MTADVIRSILIEDPLTFSRIGFSWGKPATKDIRCFRSTFPEGTTIPCLTYHDVTGLPTDPPTARYLSFDVVAWGYDELSCKGLADDVENALNEFSGDAAVVEESGETRIISVDSIGLQTFRDALEEPKTHLWYCIRTFEMIFWK